MGNPRIGRPDTMAALRAPLRVPDVGPELRRETRQSRRPAREERPRLPAPSSSLDDVAWRAHAIAANLSLLTRLTGSVRRRLPRGEVERRARLDGLHDRAIALWYELYAHALASEQGARLTMTVEAQEWHRIIRASVRECLETYQLQAQAGPVTVPGLETILARAAVPILAQFEDKPPEFAAALLPSLVRVMLAAFVEAMAMSNRTGWPAGPDRHGKHSAGTGRVTSYGIPLSNLGTSFPSRSTPTCRVAVGGAHYP